MSTRALRRLRQDQLLRQQKEAETIAEEQSHDDEDESNSEDDSISFNDKRQSNFAFFDDSEYEESESESESDGDNDESLQDVEDEPKQDDQSKEKMNDKSKLNSNQSQKRPIDEREQNMDLDTILNEFQQSNLNSSNQKSHSKSDVDQTIPNVLLQDLDFRDLDMEYAMRNLLGPDGNAVGAGTGVAGAGGGAGAGAGLGGAQQARANGSRKNNSIFPAPNWYNTNANFNFNNDHPDNNNRNQNRNRRMMNQMRQQHRKIPKPPHFMGGGLGMELLHYVDYHHLDEIQGEKNEDEWKVPFPYNDVTALEVCVSPNQPIVHKRNSDNDDNNDSNDDNNDSNDDGDTDAAKTTNDSKEQSPQLSPYHRQLWYTFNPSKTYSQIKNHYDTLMKQMTSYADANVLAMFVADNPFFAPSAYQLSLLFFQTLGNMEKGIEMLKRALCIWECASSSIQASSNIATAKSNKMDLPGFLPGSRGTKNTIYESLYKNVPVFMDKGDDDEEGENAYFFMALFRYMQTSCMMGCFDTSLATARFVLSLDPLRDPMGVLMIMDYYALATATDECTKFLINFVESNSVQIHHRDTSNNHHICHLLDMPNWAYHYALALRRQEQQGDEQSTDASISSDEALQQAIESHPSIVPLLLEKNKIDIRSRSFRADWPSVLPSLEALSMQNNKSMGSQGYEKVTTIFIQRSHKFWCADDTLSWLYKNCQNVILKMEQKQSSKKEAEEDQPISDAIQPMIGLALDRYCSCNPQDYADRFQMLPGDGNFLDENLVGMAMEYDPNRRPLLRHLRQNRNRQQQEQGQEIELQRMLLEQMQGNDQVVVVDPDAPLAELFLRTMMPWTRVQGVPQGRR